MTRARFALALALALLPALLCAPASAAPAGSLTGRVVVDGKPVAGAAVAAVPFEEPFEKARREARGEGEPKPLATASAGPDGAFVLAVPAVPGKETFFRVRVDAKRSVPSELPGVFDPSETEDLGELVLRKGEPFAGRVTGPGGRPVPGARVTLLARGRSGAASELGAIPAEATTGADGTFRFDAAAERNEIVVEAAGLATTRISDARPGAPRTISLAAGAGLAGSVKLRDGKPAAGALVRFEGGGLETRWVETGADGAFRLADLPARRGAVVADAGDEGFAEAPSATPGPESPRIALTLAPPTVLEGRTLDVATLKPVPRVKVAATAGPSVRVVRSGADGRYRIRGLRPGDLGVVADEPRYVRWSRWRVPVAKGETRTLDVPLTRGATLSGRVVDEDGRPVAEANVSVSDGEEGQFRFAARAASYDAAAKIRSRADGTFSAARLPPGENQRLTVRHPDYEKGTLGGLSLAAGATRTGAVVTLRRGLVVTGTVRDPEGNPIAGAELTLSQSRVVRASQGGRRLQMAFGGRADVPAARSGGDGRFEIRGVPAGDFALAARAPGRATEVVDPLKLARDVKPDPVEIVLSPGAAIAGYVLRKTGERAEGYLVFVRPAGKPSAGPLAPDTTPTGPDGAFYVEGLKAGEAYDLQLFGGFRGGGPGPTRKGVLAPAADLEWIVEGAGRIEGSAVDARTGQPLASYEVSVRPDLGGLGGGMFIQAGRRGGRGAADPVRVESPDGRFALEEIPAGKWQVVVEAKGYQVGRAGGVVVEEATTTDGVDVRVPPGSVLKGRVTDARTGKGVPEAGVSVQAEAGGASFQGIGVFPGLLTDLDGRFEAEGLAPGRATVVVEHPDYAERRENVELKEGGSSIEVALSRGGSLGGVVVTESRQPAAGAEVSLGGAGAPGRFGAGESTATDASGRFRFDHLSPGRYSLTAALPGLASEPVEAVLVAGEPKEDVTLVLAGGATIRGVVSGLPEAYRSAVRVAASGPREYFSSAQAGVDGRFELSGAPAGTISLRATAGDLLSGTTRGATASVTIAEGQREAEAEIVFEGNGAVSGRVTRGGQPVAAARVSVSSRSGSAGGGAQTDEQGAYRVEGLLPGDYSAWVQVPGFGGRGTSREVRVDGEATLDFDLPLASLFGFVVDGATKQPLADARVTASPDGTSGGRPGSATTDSNGRFSVEEVEPGPYTLTLRRPGYQETRDAATATEAGGDAGTIEMTRGEGLELKVLDGLYQVPLRVANVRVKDGAGANVTTTWLRLDGEGRGEIASLRPGRYALVVGSDGYATRTFEGVVVPGAPFTVALTPGGAVEVVPGPASRAKGEARLLNAFGQPHAQSTWGVEGRVVLPAAGAATLEHLAPGSYTLAVEGVAPKGFTVSEGGRTVVELP